MVGGDGDGWAGVLAAGCVTKTGSDEEVFCSDRVREELVKSDTVGCGGGVCSLGNCDDGFRATALEG